MNKLVATLNVVCLVILGMSTLHAGNGGHGPGARSGSAPMHPASSSSVSSNKSAVGSPKMTPTRFDQSRPADRDYHLKHGTPFSHGFYYSGRNHCHWTYYCWWERFGCYAYWCPYSSCYYYWCEPNGCYYPVNYATTVAPTAGAPLVTNINTNVNTNANGPGVAAVPVRPAVGAELPLPPRS